jgi:hypothetical protein
MLPPRHAPPHTQARPQVHAPPAHREHWHGPGGPQRDARVLLTPGDPVVRRGGDRQAPPPPPRRSPQAAPVALPVHVTLRPLGRTSLRPPTHLPSAPRPKLSLRPPGASAISSSSTAACWAPSRPPGRHPAGTGRTPTSHSSRRAGPTCTRRRRRWCACPTPTPVRRARGGGWGRGGRVRGGPPPGPCSRPALIAHLPPRPPIAGGPGPRLESWAFAMDREGLAAAVKVGWGRVRLGWGRWDLVSGRLAGASLHTALGRSCARNPAGLHLPRRRRAVCSWCGSASCATTRAAASWSAANTVRRRRVERKRASRAAARAVPGGAPHGGSAWASLHSGLAPRRPYAQSPGSVSHRARPPSALQA